MGQAQTSSWLIDESGHAWREGSYEAVRRFQGVRLSTNGASFLVRNAGFVRAATKGRIVSAEFVREAVNPHALIGLLHLLKELKPVGVAIIHADDGDGHATIYRSQQAWLDYLGSLITFHKAAEIRVKRPVPLCLSPFYSRYKAGEEVVRSVSDPEARDRILEQLFQGRFSLTRMKPDDRTAHFVGVGSATRAISPDRMLDMVGCSIVDAIDKNYGEWVMQQYLDVIKAGQATAEDIDATVALPDTKLILLRYSRLVSPIILSSGERLILSMTQSR